MIWRHFVTVSSWLYNIPQDPSLLRCICMYVSIFMYIYIENDWDIDTYIYIDKYVMIYPNALFVTRFSHFSIMSVSAKTRTALWTQDLERRPVRRGKAINRRLGGTPQSVLFLDHLFGETHGFLRNLPSGKLSWFITPITMVYRWYIYS
jgi:hypothetical protein